jgi:hypothetical protein
MKHALGGIAFGIGLSVTASLAWADNHADFERLYDIALADR